MRTYLAFLCGLAIAVSSLILSGCGTSSGGDGEEGGTGGGGAAGEGGMAGAGGGLGDDSKFLLAYSVRDGNPGPLNLFTSYADGSSRAKVSGPGDIELDPPQWNPDGNRLSFIEWDGVVKQLFIGAADGSTIQRVSGAEGGPGSVERSHWSPDGSRIAYEWRDDSTRALNLYLCTSDVYDCKKINRTLGSHGAAKLVGWSADGSRIAYVRKQGVDATPELITTAADGSDKQTVSEMLPYGADGLPEPQVAWSPTGSRIAYRVDEPGYALYTSEPDGTDAQEVSSLLGSSGLWFRWSPDGTRIAYVKFSEGSSGLYTNLSQGGDSRLVSTALSEGAIVFEYTWSPDGARLAYLGADDMTTPDGSAELHTNLPDGSDDRQVGVGRYAYNIAWSPDGSRLAFLASDVGNGITELFTSEPDGQNLLLVSSPPNADRGAFDYEWSPDSTLIAYTTWGGDAVSPGVYIATPDGTKFDRIGTSLSQHPGSLHWSPNAARLAYISDEDVRSVDELYSVASDGSEKHKVNPTLDENLLGRNVVWSPVPVSP